MLDIIGECSDTNDDSIWEYVLDTFCSKDVFCVERVRLDLGVLCELEIESRDDADQNELCSACA